MSFNETTFECECKSCGHQWRARTSNAPKKCAKCTSVNWNESGKRYSVLIARACGNDPIDPERSLFCIIDFVDSPEIETEDKFTVSKADKESYLRGARYPVGSAVIWIGSFELGDDQELKINSCKLIYVHERSYRNYLSGVTCAFNIKSFYQRQKTIKGYEELIRREKEAKSAQKKLNLERQIQELSKDQAELDMKRKILNEIEKV